MPLNRRQFLKTSFLATSATLISGITDSANAANPDAAHPDIAYGSRKKKEVALTFHGAGDPVIVQKLLANI